MTPRFLLIIASIGFTLSAVPDAHAQPGMHPGGSTASILALTVDAGPDKAICPGGSTLIGAPATGGTAPYTYLWSPVTGLTAPTSAITDAAPMATTQYIVTVTDAGSATASDTVLVTVLPLPTPSIVPPGPLSICTGDSIPLSANTGAGLTWRWSRNGNPIPGATGPMYTAITTGAYRVIETLNGCVDSSAEAVIIVKARPTVYAGKDTMVCLGTPVKLGNAATGGVGPYLYQWSPATGLDNATSATPTATPPATTQYIVTVVDFSGCVARDTVILTIRPVPVVTVGSDIPICGPGTVALGSTMIAGTPPYTYTWTPTTGLSSATSPDPTATVLISMRYVLTVIDATGCEGRDTVIVIVLPKPSAHAGLDARICRNASVQLGYPATGGTPGYTYSWSPTSGLASPTAALTLAAPTMTTEYVVTVTDTNGCQGRDTVLVTVNPPPMPNAGGDAVICRGTSIQLGQPASGGTPPYSYHWSPAAGLSDTTTATPMAQPQVTTWYTLTITDAEGCQEKDSVHITVLPTPSPTVSPAGPLAFCDGGAATLTANPGTGIAYRWSKDGSPIETAAGQQLVVTTGGRYRVIETLGGCTDSSAEVVITVNPRPIANAGPDIAMCPRSPVAIGQPAGSGTPPFTYLWTPATGLSSITTSRPTASPTVTTQYIVTVTDAAGCSSRDTVLVTVLTSPPSDFDGPGTVCPGSASTYDATASTDVSHTWTVTGGTIIAGDGTPSITVHWGPAGRGSVRLLVRTIADGCQAEKLLAVTIDQSLFPAITPSSARLCNGGSLVLDAGSGYASYHWNTSDTTRRITVSTVGTYIVTVTDGTGCTGNDTVLVTAGTIITPIIAADGPTSFCEGDSVRLSIPDNYQACRWSNGDSTRTIVVRDSGVYIVTVTDSTGCSTDSRPMHVDVVPPPTPSIIGPVYVCRDSRMRYDAFSARPVRYAWTVTGGSIIGPSTASSAVIHWQTLGMKEIVVTAIDSASGCMGSTRLPVQVGEGYRPWLIVSDSSLCEGDTATLRVAGDFEHHEWRRDGAPLSGETGPVLRTTQPGVYTVDVSDSVCSGTSEPCRITVLTRPTVGIIPSGPLCHGGSIQLRTSEPFVRYEWSTGLTQPAITVTTPGKYHVRVRNVDGCEATASIIVTMDSIPAMQAARWPTSVCLNSTITYSVLDSSLFRYSWIVTGGRLHAGQGTHAIDVAWDTAGTAALACVIETPGGCRDTVRASVTIDSILHPTLYVDGRRITRDTLLHACIGRVLTITTDQGYARHDWSNGAVSDTIHITALAAPFVCGVLVSDGGDCEGISPFVTIIGEEAPAPAIITSGDSILCPGEELALSLPPPFRVMRWSTGDTAQTIVVRAAGMYHADVVDTTGCIGTTPPLVVVTHPLSPADIDGDTAVCVQARRTYTTPVSPGATYAWRVNGGIVEAGDGTPAVTIRWGTAGLGGIGIDVNDGECASFDSLSVAIGTGTHMVVTASRMALCGSDSSILCAPAGFTSYTWSTMDSTPCIIVNSPGRFWVIAHDSVGCEGRSDTLVIRAGGEAHPMISAMGSMPFCPGDSVVLVCPPGFTHHTWSRNALPIPGADSTTFVAHDAGVYTVDARDSSGCDVQSPGFVVFLHPDPAPTVTQAGRLLTCSSAVTWQWYRNDTLIAGATAQQHQAMVAGWYHVCVTDSTGCRGCSPRVEVTGAAATSTIALQCPSPSVHSAGTVVTIGIELTASANLPATSSRFTTDVRFDRFVMQPQQPYTVVRTEGRDMVIRIAGSRTPDQTAGPLAGFRAMVLLADVPCSDIVVDAFTWDDPAIAVTLPASSCEACVDVCHEGGDRLVDLRGRVDLMQNRPNPFNAMTRIEFETIDASRTDLAVYDMHGRRVITLVDGIVPVGRHVVTFDASALPSGVYRCMLTTAGVVASRAMILAR